MRYFLTLLLAVVTLSACESIDDERIPPSAVRLEFASVGEWNTYGVAATPDYRMFIKSKNIPTNYPYTSLSYTGFGGILLVCDVNNVPKAFDLACPVERKNDVRVTVDTENLCAKCPKCGSTFDIYSLGGYPLSGKAADQRFGLQQYTVTPNNTGGYLITR